MTIKYKGTRFVIGADVVEDGTLKIHYVYVGDPIKNVNFGVELFQDMIDNDLELFELVLQGTRDEEAIREMTKGGVR